MSLRAAWPSRAAALAAALCTLGPARTVFAEHDSGRLPARREAKLSARASAPWAKARARVGRPPNADDFWDRARYPELVAERRTLRAIERVLLGRGDDYDTLTARVALLDFIRGEQFTDVRVEYVLTRLKLESTFSYGSRLEARFAKTLERPAPAPLRAMGYQDYGALAALRNDAASAFRRFDVAVSLTWEPDGRDRALLGRGFAAMALGRARDAVVDFTEAAQTTPSRRLAVAAHWALSAAYDRIGEQRLSVRSAERAQAIGRARAAASRRPIFDGVAVVPAYEEAYLRGLRFEAEADEAEDAEAEELAQKRTCEAFRRYLVHAEPDGSPWVAVARQHLAGC